MPHSEKGESDRKKSLNGALKRGRILDIRISFQIVFKFHVLYNSKIKSP